MTQQEHERIVQPIELAIQKMLLDLDESLAEHGRKIDHVKADVRCWANMSVTIMTESVS